MRILHVVPTYLPAVRYGGPIFAVHGLCRALANLGHDVEVYTTNVDGSETSPVPVGEPVFLDGVRIRYFPSPLFRRLYWAPALGDMLSRNVVGFDVIHLHSVFLWPTWTAARQAKKNAVPYVLSPRGMLVRELIARRSRFVKSAWIKLIERSNLRDAAVVHLTSELEAFELEQFGWTLPRRAVIANGVDDPVVSTDAIARDVMEIIGQQPLIVFLGRLSWKKGLDRLLHAFVRTPSGTLAIAGTDDENYSATIKDLARELGIEHRVRFLPRTLLGADKEAILAAAKMFVLASYSENFGNTVLEAMRRSVPVIVTPEVGAAEIVLQASGGIVTEGSPDAFGGAMRSLLENDDLAKSMGRSGKCHVLGRYGWTAVAAQMEDLYVSVGRRP